MTDVTRQPVTQAQLAEWYQCQQDLAALKAKEALLRGAIFHFFFPTPVEGTNKFQLNDGTGAQINATHVINRTVDPGSLDAMKAQQQVEGSNLPKINLDKLIKYKPEVNIKEYRTLTEEERQYFDQCLIIKDGSPQVKIEIPKRAK